jgi:hypothetical protein
MLTRVTEDFKAAIQQWLTEEQLTLREAGKLIGTSHGSIGNVLTGMTKTIRPKLMMALEPYINKYRDPEELQKSMKRKTSTFTDQTAAHCRMDVNIISNIQKYKDDNKLSYEDMRNKFNIPIIKLAEWMEADYSEEDFFTLSANDFPIFAAFVSQVLSEQFV